MPNVNNKNILQSIEQLKLSLIATFCHVDIKVPSASGINVTTSDVIF